MIRLGLMLIPFLLVASLHAADPPVISPPFVLGAPELGDEVWVEIDRTDSYIYYAGPGTIRRKGSLVQMWILSDYTTIQTVAGKSLASEKTKMEYDCSEGKSRFLESYEYSSHMGGREPIYSDTNRRSEWFAVRPDSAVDRSWQYACGRWAKIRWSEFGAEYMDLQTVHREGERVKVWEMIDYPMIQQFGGAKFLSNKSQWEYDCLLMRHRILGRYLYSGHMGDGEMVEKGTEGLAEWINLGPGNPYPSATTMWNIACGGGAFLGGHGVMFPQPDNSRGLLPFVPK